MRIRLTTLLVLGLAFGLAGTATAQEILLAFDDLAVPGGTAAPAGESYAAQGAHFAAGEFGLLGGISNGDPGNWDLDGTRGPWFQGYNAEPFSMTLTFDRRVEGFMLDVSRSGGSEPADTFTLTGFRGAEAIEEVTIPLPSINTWATVVLESSGLDRVEWATQGSSFHGYGIDHIRYAFVPEADSYRCYKAKDRKTPAPFASTEVQAVGALEDKILQVRKPVGYCEPVDVAGEGIGNPDDLLVCYQIKDAKTDPKQPKFAKQDAATTDAFGNLGLQLKKATTLCVRAGETP